MFGMLERIGVAAGEHCDGAGKEAGVGGREMGRWGRTRSRRRRGRRSRWRSEAACTMTEPWGSGSLPFWKTLS